MEDASGEDLDWFWRGWFYGIEPCDISLDSVKWSNLSLENASTRPAERGRRVLALPKGFPKPLLNSFDDISKIRNREDKKISFATDADTSVRDFYWRYDRDLVEVDRSSAETSPLPPATTNDTLTYDQKMSIAGNKNIYELNFSNKGGLVMPIIIEWTYLDGTKETDRIPVQIWRLNENNVTKTFIKDKQVASIKLDPMRETADINEANNNWPTLITPSKFKLYKTGQGGGRGAATGSVNPMQREIKK